jgi:hypothetical protein
MDLSAAQQFRIITDYYSSTSRFWDSDGALRCQYPQSLGLDFKMIDSLSNREIPLLPTQSFLVIICHFLFKNLVTFKSCGTGSSRHRTELFYDLDPAPMKAGFAGGF